MARILFCEQFYYPDGWSGTELLRDITVHMQRSGHEVTVLCGGDPYVQVAGDPGPDPRASGIRILRTPRIFGGDIKRFKLVRQVWFYLSATALMLSGTAPDLIVSLTNPPLVVVIAALTAKLRRRPLLVIAQDLYPEVLSAHGVLQSSSLSAKFLGAMFRWAYRSARCVVALGPAMAARIVAKGVNPDRVTVISNWATGDPAVIRGDANELRARWSLQGRYVVLYSGNLGIGHEFETLLDAIDKVRRDVPEVLLLVIGRGGRLAEVRTLVATRGMQGSVRFEDLVPAELLPQSIGLADLAVVTLRPGFEGLMVPSKMLGYMARGIPSLYIGPPSDISELVESSSGGLAFNNGDAAGVAAAIVASCRGALDTQTMANRASRFYESHLSARHGLSKYRNTLENCLRLPVSRSSHMPHQ